MNVNDDATTLGDGGLRNGEAEQLSCGKSTDERLWKVESVKVGVGARPLTHKPIRTSQQRARNAKIRYGRNSGDGKINRTSLSHPPAFSPQPQPRISLAWFILAESRADNRLGAVYMTATCVPLGG